MGRSSSLRSLVLPFLALLILLAASLACGSSTDATPIPKVKTATPETAAAAPTKAESAEKAAVVSTRTEAPPESAEAAPTSTEALAPTAEPAGTAKIYLGDAIEEDGYGMAVSGIENPAKPGMLYESKPGKKLVAAEVILSNLTGEPLSANPLNAQLIDQDGFTYQAELGARDDQLLSVTLDQGERVRGWIAFEVPENAVPATLKYSTSLFGGTALQSSLETRPADAASIPFSSTEARSASSRLGDVVEQYGYSLAASQVQDPAKGGTLYQPKTDRKLVAVELTVGNVSADEPLSVNPLYAYLVDTDGYVYGLELGALDEQLDATLNEGLAPGQKAKGWVAFEMPKDAVPAAVKYQTEPLSGKAISAGLNK
jgi:hypothetical protein